jgi:predicted dehydrogenase
MNVGIVGCGVISRHYAEHASAFDFKLAACADIDRSYAEALAAEHRIEALTLEELLADPAIDVVLNLTSASAHAEVTRAALAAGKHVYSEKPLASDAAAATELVAEAERRGLLLGCAPDTFLGGAFQAARALIDEGAIGEPVAVSAAMLVGGPDSWHPRPEQFFQDGAGPLLDMGPYYLTAIVALLGRVRAVAGFASTLTAERTIAVGPRAGSRFVVDTPTHIATVMELETGATANLVMSFEATDRYVCDLEIHGREGVVALPDPNAFGGPLRLRRNRRDWEDVTYPCRGPREARGIGLQDLVEAAEEGRAPRASGRLAAHVVDVARSVLQAATESRTAQVATPAERPDPLRRAAAGLAVTSDTPGVTGSSPVPPTG